MLKMKIPDLAQLVLKSFDVGKQESFFQSQEILQGMSLCDIGLSDSEIIINALKKFKPGRYSMHSSILEQVIAGDKLRKDAFIQAEFYPK